MNIDNGCFPNCAAQHAAIATNMVEILSHPWSNNSPNGDDVLVLLACLPSIASND